MEISHGIKEDRIRKALERGLCSLERDLKNKKLDLRRPIYQQTAAYGHFGKENLPWEQVIKID